MKSPRERGKRKSEEKIRFTTRQSQSGMKQVRILLYQSAESVFSKVKGI